MTERKTFIDSENGMEYIEGDDGMYHPNIGQYEEQEAYSVTEMGWKWIEYMKVKHPERYIELGLKQELKKRAWEVEEEAWEMIRRIEAQYLEKNPYNPADYMDTITKMQAAKNYAKEVVEKDYLYHFH